MLPSLMAQLTVVRKQICPTFVHTDEARLIIIFILLATSTIILIRTAKYFNG
jgi:hypothetical protein